MINGDTLTTPDGKTYDLSLPNTAEGRVHEIAFVTRPKAPELVALFARAAFALGRILPEVYLGYVLSGREVARRKAVVTIDVVPSQLTTRKLPSNAENRQALLDSDEEYNKALEREAHFDAAVMLLKLKIKDMDSAINALKKVIVDTEQVYNRPNFNTSNTNMDAGQNEDKDWVKKEWDFNDPQDTSPLDTPKQQTTATPTGFKIGKPRY